MEHKKHHTQAPLWESSSTYRQRNPSTYTARKHTLMLCCTLGQKAKASIACPTPVPLFLDDTGMSHDTCSAYKGSRTSMNAEYGVRHQRGHRQKAKKIGKVFPHIGVAILAHALVKEAIHLRQKAKTRTQKSEQESVVLVKSSHSPLPCIASSTIVEKRETPPARQQQEEKGFWKHQESTVLSMSFQHQRALVSSPIHGERGTRRGFVG